MANGVNRGAAVTIVPPAMAPRLRPLMDMESHIVLACVMVMSASAAAAQTHPLVVGSVQQITVAHGDTWTSLGARFGVDPETLKTDNRTSAPRLVAGHLVTIDNRHIVPS